jgi:hypothetical protein
LLLNGLHFKAPITEEEEATGAKLSLVEHLDKLMGHQQSGHQE